MPSYDDEATELLYRHPTGTGFLPVIPPEPPRPPRPRRPHRPVAWTVAAWLTVLILLLAAAGVARVDMIIWHWH